jgi:uncharacterized membrane protein
VEEPVRSFFNSLNALLILGMVSFAIWAWPRLPDQIPTHFGVEGLPDAWSEKGFWSWFGVTSVGIGIALSMSLFTYLLPRKPHWVNLPDRRKLSDLPEAARPPVIEMFSGFLAMVQTQLLIIFALIQAGAWKSAMGESSQGVMIVVLLLSILTSPFLLVVFFLRLQGALNRGQELARRAEAGRSSE